MRSKLKDKVKILAWILFNSLDRVSCGRLNIGTGRLYRHRTQNLDLGSTNSRKRVKGLICEMTVWGLAFE